MQIIYVVVAAILGVIGISIVVSLGAALVAIVVAVLLAAFAVFIIVYVGLFLYDNGPAMWKFVRTTAVKANKMYLWVLLKLHSQKKGKTIGNPEVAARHWKFQRGNTCAINAQRIVLAIHGVFRSESQLVARQSSYGRHTANGSSDISMLLEGYGLKSRMVNFASRRDLPLRLFSTFRKGRVAIVPVNSSLINQPDPAFDSPIGARVDHVVIATAMEPLGNGHYKVYYTDTGVADGRLKAVDERVLVGAGENRFVEGPKIPA